MCGLFFQAQVKSFLFAHPQESGDDFFRGFYKAVLPTDDGRINQFNCSTPHVSFSFAYNFTALSKHFNDDYNSDFCYFFGDYLYIWKQF